MCPCGSSFCHQIIPGDQPPTIHHARQTHVNFGTPLSFSIPVLPLPTEEQTFTFAKIHCYVGNRVKLRVMNGQRTVENENRWGLRVEKLRCFPQNGKINTLIWQILWVTLKSFKSSPSLSEENQLLKQRAGFKQQQLDLKLCRWNQRLVGSISLFLVRKDLQICSKRLWVTLLLGQTASRPWVNRQPQRGSGFWI